MARGPVKRVVIDVRVRDWWERWVDRASWAVLSLYTVSVSQSLSIIVTKR